MRGMEHPAGVVALSLPVVGETHPLRRHYRRFLYAGLAAAAAFHLAGFAGWLIARQRADAAAPAPIVMRIKLKDLTPPPSIEPRAPAPQQVEVASLVPQVNGVPEPVPDLFAPDQTILSRQEMEKAPGPVDWNALSGGGDSIVVVAAEPAADALPAPDDFRAVEEMPVLINLPAPVYPEMARQAEVEGTVLVRVLVGKDGRVHDAIIASGVPMLNDAALASARAATFRPALQQHKPVAVWVQIPMRFTLR